MQMIECWIVRKGEDARKVAKVPPEVADVISNHADCNPKWCLMCGEDHESAAVMGWREPDGVIFTAGICAQCTEPSDEPRRFSGWAARFSPRTGSERRHLTAEGQEQLDLEDKPKRPSKH